MGRRLDQVTGAWGARGTGFGQENTPWPDMTFLRCTHECGYILRVAKIVAQYVDD